MDSFWGNIFRPRQKKEDPIITCLKRIPIFENLNRRELEALERIIHERVYKPGEVIFHQGDAGVGMYIIEKGVVQIIYEPTNQLLAELTDGEFFGELALLDESPRSATAMAKTECKMLGFFQSDLFGLLERDPRLGVKIVLELARIIGERLKHSNEQISRLREEVRQLKERLGEGDEQTGTTVA